MEKQTLMVFPCDFPIKIIGKSSPKFLTEITAIILQHYPDLPSTAITSQLSKNGNYQSITTVVHALDQASLDALYKDLTQHQDIHMVL